MRILLLLVSLALSNGITLAQGNVIDAKNLLEVCTTASMNWIDFCNGFMQATHDLASADGNACVPDGTSRTSLVKLFEREATRTIAANPEAGELPGVSIAIKILEANYPCM